MGKKGDSTRQHIRAEAFKLFAAHGYTKVTMQEICDKCGLSKGGLYRHYTDKDALFVDLLTHMQREEGEREAQRMKENISAVTILESYLAHIRKDLSSGSPTVSRALYEFCMERRKTRDAADRDRANVLSGCKKADGTDATAGNGEAGLTGAAAGNGKAGLTGAAADNGAKFLSAQYERGKAVLLSLLAYGIARDELHPADPESAADAVLFLVEGLQMIHPVMPVPDRTLDGLFLQIKILMGV